MLTKFIHLYLLSGIEYFIEKCEMYFFNIVEEIKKKEKINVGKIR